jgi:hypothetical protein
MKRISEAQHIANCATPAGRTLLRTLRQATALDKWDTRSTRWANSWNLLKLKKGQLKLTALGWKVANLL